MEGAPVEGTEGRGGRIRFSLLRDLALGSTKLTGVTITDVVAERVDLTASDLNKARVSSVRFSDCRCLATNWAEAILADVTFERCTLEMSNFRFARLERVVFEGCDLKSADFANSMAAEVVFKSCTMEGADFREARLTTVDLRRSQVKGIKGMAGLRGATITVGQLLDLAPALAQEMGIDVES